MKVWVVFDYVSEKTIKVFGTLEKAQNSKPKKKKARSEIYQDIALSGYLAEANNDKNWQVGAKKKKARCK